MIYIKIYKYFLNVIHLIITLVIINTTTSLAQIIQDKSRSNSNNNIQISKTIIQCDDNIDDNDNSNNIINLWNQRARDSKNSFYNNIRINPLRFCSKYKLVVNLQLRNNVPLQKGKRLNSIGEGALVLIDNAIEESTGTSIKFSSPIAIKLQQGPIFQLYPIRYAFTVNAKPFEVIHNSNNTLHFNGCNDFEKNSICGYEADETGNVFYNLGYCCNPCNDGRNNNNYNNDRTCDSRTSTSIHCFKTNEFWYGVHELSSPNLFHQVHLRMFRLAEQIEPNATESVKWTNLFGNDSVPSPSIHLDSVGLTKYEQSINNTHSEMNSEQLTITYINNNDNNSDSFVTTQYLNSQNQLVLIPLPHSSQFTSQQVSIELPKPIQTDSISESILIVSKSQVVANGNACNRIGVGSSAFIHQPNRCSMNKKKHRACFRHQPFDLWYADAKSNVRKVHYRLKYFGPIHSSAPIKIIDNVLHLVMEHEQEAYSSQLQLQLSTSNLQLIQPNYSAMILSAIIDSSGTHGSFLFEIANKGYVSSKYQIQISNCEPISKNSKLVSKEKSIAGQASYSFKFRNLTYYSHDQIKKNGHKLIEKTWCTLSVLNSFKEIIAARSILISPSDTCICYLDCVCTCAKERTRCIKLDTIDLIAAGIDYKELLFPNAKDLEDESFMNIEPLMQSAKANPISTIIGLILFLLLLGFCKGLLGKCCFCCSCCNSISKAGLCYFYNTPRLLPHYYEKRYARRYSVLYNDEGFPIDPLTKEPTVERLSSSQIIAYNTILFISWPCLCFHWILNWCCKTNCCHTMSDADDEDDYGNKKKKKYRWLRKNKERDNNKRDSTKYEPIPSEDQDIQMQTLYHKNNEEDKDEIINSSDEEVVLYERKPSNSKTKNVSSQEDAEFKAQNSTKSNNQKYHPDDKSDEETRQYGHAFFMDSSNLGSPVLAPSRKDSNMSLMNVRETTSADYKYRRTSAGQQEYAMKMMKSQTPSTPGTPAGTVSQKHSDSKRELGVWQRTPSDWSVSGGGSKKKRFHDSDIQLL